MKRVTLALASIVMMIGSVGCHHNLCNTCGPNGQRGGGNTKVGRLPNGHHLKHHNAQPGPAGPPSAAYAYPYYTVRAPRDFLMDDPPSIGY